MHKTSANARSEVGLGARRHRPIAGVSWTYIGTLVKTRDSCDRHFHGSQAIADTRGGSRALRGYSVNGVYEAEFAGMRIAGCGLRII